jgi:hypothetical protein
MAVPVHGVGDELNGNALLQLSAPAKLDVLRAGLRFVESSNGVKQ